MWLEQHEQLVRIISGFSTYYHYCTEMQYYCDFYQWTFTIVFSCLEHPNDFIQAFFYFLGNSMITLIGQVLKFINITDSVRIWRCENLQTYLIYIVPIYMKFYSGFTNEILKSSKVRDLLCTWWERYSIEWMYFIGHIYMMQSQITFLYLTKEEQWGTAVFTCEGNYSCHIKVGERLGHAYLSTVSHILLIPITSLVLQTLTFAGPPKTKLNYLIF